MTAVAVGMVGTAGVAAAATVGTSPVVPMVSEPASIESDVLDQLPAGYGDLGDLGELELELPDVPDVPITIPSLPDLNLPTLPALAPMLVIPGVDALPIDPAALAASAHQAIGQVAALLPSPAALQAAVLDCVSDVAALVPAPGPTMSGSPLGFLTGLLGGLTAASTPSVPDPAAVQAAITSCVANVMGVLPDPTALASALTAAFGPSLSVPIADVIGQLTGSLPAAPDAGQLLDLVTALVGATGSPTELIGQLTGALDGVVPAPLDQLISLPLTVLHQLFTTVGRA